FSTMVLLSAPPIPTSEIQADRVLLVTGAYDIGRIRQFASLMNDLGNPHIESWQLRWAAHSSAIFNPVYIRRIVEWLGGDGDRLKTSQRILALAAMFIAVVVLSWTALTGAPVTTHDLRLPAMLVRFIAASGASILILRFFVPLAWL